MLYIRYYFPSVLFPCSILPCLHTGWHVSCWALSTSTFTAFTSSLMLYPCWTCCSHWPKPAPSQTMVSMNHRQSLVSRQSNCQINLEEVWCCLRECCMHMRQHPDKVTHDSPKGLYWAGGSVGLTSFFLRGSWAAPVRSATWVVSAGPQLSESVSP